jgi:lipid II:glycine glycyltransferase (peptidoglycan interpeptide bridge formation enzyme)
VAVDLTLTDDVLVDQYRDGHAYDIDKATREGVEGVHDKAWDYYDDFIAMYYDTMRRVNADSHYFFDRSYFSRMRELLGDHLHLFVAVKDGTAISGSLFFHCGSIIQYHLSGTASDHLSLAPSKLLLDRVRRWGNEIGAQTLHLGGGVGGREDGVFRFKSGFSDQTHRFSVWRYIVDQDVYRELVDQKRQWNEARVLEVVDKDFFPAYRAPVVAKDDEQ